MARSLNPSGFLFEKNDIYDSFFISLYEPTPLLQLQLLIPPPHIIDFTKIYNQIFMYFFFNCEYKQVGIVGQGFHRYYLLIIWLTQNILTENMLQMTENIS